MIRTLKIGRIPSDYLIVMLLLVGGFFFGSYFEIRFVMVLSLLLLLAFSFQILRKRSYLCAAFIITFFTFLCGRIIVNWLTGCDSLLDGAFIYGTGPTDA